MASTKRVSGDYDIYANTVTINGNLTVIGNQTTLESTNSSITDNIIVLNSGETGAGVTLGTAGIQVDRGSSNDVLIRYNESGSRWEFTNDGSTYSGIAAVGGSATAGGSSNNIQYNSSTTLLGSNNFNYFAANGNVQIGTTLISNTGILSTTTSSDLILNALGSGTTYLKDTLKLDFQSGSTPTNVSNTVQVLANTPGGGGSGLFVVNSNGSDELVSKTKATVLALIFS